MLRNRLVDRHDCLVRERKSAHPDIGNSGAACPDRNTLKASLIVQLIGPREAAQILRRNVRKAGIIGNNPLIAIIGRPCFM